MSGGRETVVVHASGDELRVVSARVVQGRVELSNACSFLSGNKDPEASSLRDETTLDALAEYVTRRGWIGRDLVCLIGGSSVACYHYDMPPLKGNALHQAVLLKLGQQLHFDVAEAIVAVERHGPPDTEGNKQIRVGVTAVRRELAEAAVRTAARVGLKMKAVSAAPAAITAVAQGASDETGGLHAFLYVDERVSSLVVLDGASPRVTSELPIGMSDLTKALMRPIVSGDDIIELDEAQATALRNEVGIPVEDQKIDSLGITGDRIIPLLEPTLQQFAKQLTQWLTFASTTVAGERLITSLKIVGPGAAIGGFAKSLGSRLSIDVDAEPWLTGAATLVGPAEGLSLDAFAAVVGAVRYGHILPDLIPPAFRKQRKMRRIRKSVAFCGFIAAAAIVVLALLFDRVGGALLPSISAHQRQLAGVQQVVGDNREWAVQQDAVARLRKQLDDFSRAGPSWVGICKEISALLPREVQATEFVVRSNEDGFQLVINGAVYPGERGLSFDEAVQQTLLLLQRSAFFKQVQLLTVNREPSRDGPNAAGTLKIGLDLVYARPKA